MVTMTATVDGAASRAFQAALDELAKSLGDGASTAPRRAAINLCKTFRNNTRVARKLRPVEAVPIDPVGAPGTKFSSKWLSNPLRRLVDVKFRDRPELRGVYRYLECTPKHGGLQREAKRLLGENKMRGLAKHSWGWVMHNIFSGAAPDTPWRKRKNDKRNPKDATTDSTSSSKPSTTSATGFARICNRLDYIVPSLKISVDEATRKAANKMIRPLINARLRKQGVSPDDIKSMGHRVQKEWMRQFGT